MLSQTDILCTNVPHPEGIPAELRDTPRWILWRYEERDGKTTKVPCGVNGDHLAVTVSRNWKPLDTVLSWLPNTPADGIGFCFSTADDLCGVDLDHGREAETGELLPWAAEIVRDLDSYTEVSVSGEGVHILCHGSFPHNGRHGGIEMYADGRFFVCTGNHLDGSPTTINERSAQLVALNAGLFAPPKDEPDPSTRLVSHPTATLSITDTDLIAMASNARDGKGDRFRRLWNGDTSDYGGDASQADLAACNALAWWTNGDAGRVDALFRLSGLYREKWNERHRADGATYGEMTTAKAIDGCRGGYDTDFNRQAGPWIELSAEAAMVQGADPDPRIAQLLAVIANLLETVRRQDTELVSLRSLVRQNAALQALSDKGPRDSILAVLAEAESAKSRGLADERGFSRLPLGEAARKAGFSRPTVSAHLRLYAKSALCEMETRPDGYRLVDDDGVITGYLPAIFVKFPGDANATRQAILDWIPERPKIGRPAGKRTCPEHPGGDVRLDKKWSCAVCGKILDTEETVIHAEETSDATPEPDGEQVATPVNPFTTPSEDTPSDEPDISQAADPVKGFTTPIDPHEESEARESIEAAWTIPLVRFRVNGSDTARINLTESSRCICGASATAETDGTWHCSAHPPSLFRPPTEQVELVEVF